MRNRNPRVDPLLERFDSSGLQDAKGRGAGQSGTDHDREREDHHGLDREGERADKFLYGDGNAEHKHADRYGVRRDDPEHFALQPNQQGELGQNVLDNIAEPVLRKVVLQDRSCHNP